MEKNEKCRFLAWQKTPLFLVNVSRYKNGRHKYRTPGKVSRDCSQRAVISVKLSECCNPALSTIYRRCKAIERATLHFLVFLLNSAGTNTEQTCCNINSPVNMRSMVVISTAKLSANPQTSIVGSPPTISICLSLLIIKRLKGSN